MNYFTGQISNFKRCKEDREIKTDENHGPLLEQGIKWIQQQQKRKFNIFSINEFNMPYADDTMGLCMWWYFMYNTNISVVENVTKNC